MCTRPSLRVVSYEHHSRVHAVPTSNSSTPTIALSRTADRLKEVGSPYFSRPVRASRAQSHPPVPRLFWRERPTRKPFAENSVCITIPNLHFSLFLLLLCVCQSEPAAALLFSFVPSWWSIISYGGCVMQSPRTTALVT